jgi:hypothetical protein
MALVSALIGRMREDFHNTQMLRERVSQDLEFHLQSSGAARSGFVLFPCNFPLSSAMLVHELPVAASTRPTQRWSNAEDSANAIRGHQSDSVLVDSQATHRLCLPIPAHCSTRPDGAFVELFVTALKEMLRLEYLYIVVQAV